MSDTFEIDLSSYVPSQGEYIPPGEYLFSVEDMDDMVSSAGNNMWKLTYSVVEGEHAGKIVTDFLPLTQKVLWKIVAFLGAVGVPTPKKRLSIPKGMVVGKVFKGVVVDNEYKGRVSPQLSQYISLSEGADAGPSDLGDDDDEVEPTPAKKPELTVVDADEEEESIEETPTPKTVNARTQAKPAPAEEDLDL